MLLHQVTLRILFRFGTPEASQRALERNRSMVMLLKWGEWWQPGALNDFIRVASMYGVEVHNVHLLADRLHPVACPCRICAWHIPAAIKDRSCVCSAVAETQQSGGLTLKRLLRTSIAQDWNLPAGCSSSSPRATC